MGAQKANFQHPEDHAPRRPYGLTEEDHLKLYRTRNVLRLFQYMNQDKHLTPPDPELVGDFHCLLADLIDQVLESAESDPTGGKHA